MNIYSLGWCFVGYFVAEGIVSACGWCALWWQEWRHRKRERAFCDADFLETEYQGRSR